MLKSSEWKSLTRTALLSLSLAVLPLAGFASAETSTPDKPNLETTRVQDTRAEHPFNWGWLGLLGLAGLLGMRPRNDHVVRHNVAVETPRSATTRP